MLKYIFDAFYKDSCIYLKGTVTEKRGRDTQGDIFSSLVYSLNGCDILIWPSESQESEIPSGSFLWVAGAQVLGPSIAFPGTLTRDWTS